MTIEDRVAPVLIEAILLEDLASELEEGAWEATNGDSSVEATSAGMAYRDAASRIRQLIVPGAVTVAGNRFVPQADCPACNGTGVFAAAGYVEGAKEEACLFCLEAAGQITADPK